MSRAAATLCRRLTWLQVGARADGSLCPAADDLLTDEIVDLWCEMDEAEHAQALAELVR